MKNKKVNRMKLGELGAKFVQLHEKGEHKSKHALHLRKRLSCWGRE